MNVKPTSRGFELIEFEDSNGEKCSIQQSSATGFERGPGGDYIWLGLDNARPKILASKAAANGIQTTATTGWIDVPLPPDAYTGGRMHLDVDQAKELVRHLKCWIKSGSLRMRRANKGRTAT